MWFLGTSVVLMTLSTPASLPSPVRDSVEAVKLVQSMYSDELKSDSKLRITYDSTEQSAGHLVYLIHVYDGMSNHTATIDWVDVRDDGRVKSEFFQSAFGTPHNYEQMMLR